MVQIPAKMAAADNPTKELGDWHSQFDLKLVHGRTHEGHHVQQIWISRCSRVERDPETHAQGSRNLDQGARDDSNRWGLEGSHPNFAKRVRAHLATGLWHLQTTTAHSRVRAL